MDAYKYATVATVVMAVVVMVGVGMLTMLIYGCVKYNFSGANPLERYEAAQMHWLVVIEGVNALCTCLYCYQLYIFFSLVELLQTILDQGGQCEFVHLHFQH